MGYCEVLEPQSCLGDDERRSMMTSLAVIEEPRKAKVLMIHGKAQSGTSFAGKTRFFKRLIQDLFPPFPQQAFHPSFPGGAQLFYPTAPHRVPATNSTTVNLTEDDIDHDTTCQEDVDLDAWTWALGDYAGEVSGVETSIEYMLKFLQKEGPFAGVVGFSTGACMALTLASILERAGPAWLLEERGIDSTLLHRPFQFAICCSGFMLEQVRYRDFYYPRIKTPILHFVGQYDPVIPESNTLKFVKNCRNSIMAYHPGAHFVPRSSNFQKIMVDFIRDCVG